MLFFAVLRILREVFNGADPTPLSRAHFVGLADLEEVQSAGVPLGDLLHELVAIPKVELLPAGHDSACKSQNGARLHRAATCRSKKTSSRPIVTSSFEATRSTNAVYSVFQSRALKPTMTSFTEAFSYAIHSILDCLRSVF